MYLSILRLVCRVFVFFLNFSFCNTMSPHSAGWTGTHYVTQLEAILLPQFPKYWVYRYEPPSQHFGSLLGTDCQISGKSCLGFSCPQEAETGRVQGQPGLHSEF